MPNIKEIYDPNCTQCPLGATCRNRCLPGVGEQTAKLLIVGTYPNEAEDIAGRIIKEGGNSLIFRILEKVINANPGEVYFTNLVKCHSDLKGVTAPNVAACSEYLKSEISILKPRCIVTLGAVPLEALTGLTGSLGKYRGNFQDFTFEVGDFEPEHLEIKVMPTFHPNYAAKLANPKATIRNMGLDIYKAYCWALDIEAGATDTVLVRVDTVEKMQELIDYCIQAGLACFDFETTGLYPYNGDKPTMLSISFQPGAAYVLPLFHHERPICPELALQLLTMFYEQVIMNREVIKINHNIKFDFRVFGSLGMKGVLGRVEDTMLQHGLIDDSLKHGLKEINSNIFPQFAGYEDEVKKYKWDKIPFNVLEKYGGSDTDVTLRLWLHFTTELLEMPEVYRVYRNVMLPALKWLYKMEDRGVHIDQDLLNEGIAYVGGLLSEQLQKLRDNPIVNRFEIAEFERHRKEALHKITTQLNKYREAHPGQTKISVTEQKYLQQINDLKTGAVTVYEGLNFRSSTQMEQLLYGERGFNFEMVYDYKSRKKGGTGEHVIKQLPFKGSFLDDFLEYRSLEKTNSTYLLGFKDLLDANGKLHPNFHIIGTRTGRLSSSDPNLQNITQPDRIKYPNARKAAAYIKRMFTVPEEGFCMVQVDFSQMELRLVAMYAQCKEMLDVYDAGLDIHAKTAAAMNGLTMEQFYQQDKATQKLQRFSAKAVNFGFIYGATAETFRQTAKADYDLNFTPRQAEKFRSDFFTLYPELKDYHKRMVKEGRQNGYVTTLFGSRRQLKEISSPNEQLRGHAERVAVNTPIQGTSGQVTIFAGNLLVDRLRPTTYIWNNIHDAMLFNMETRHLQSECSVIRATCEGMPVEDYFGVSFSGNERFRGVKLGVDFEMSAVSWKDLEEIKIG